MIEKVIMTKEDWLRAAERVLKEARQIELQKFAEKLRNMDEEQILSFLALVDVIASQQAEIERLRQKGGNDR